MYNNICVVRLSAIGDAVLTVPMVRAIQSAYPNAQITWIIGRVAHSLLSGLSGVNFIVIDKPRSLYDYFSFWKMIKQHRFDVLIAMQASLRANLLYPLISAKRKIGFDRARAKDGHHLFIHESIPPKAEHLLDSFMSFAISLGAKKPVSPLWQLSLLETDKEWLGNICPTPYIVINPAASKLERNWLIERYIELIKRIQEKYPALNIIICGSKEDTKFVQPIIDNTEVINLVGKTSLKQLAVLLDKAECLIAPDTGSVHIATAMETQVIGLYAVITSKLSGPYLSMGNTVDKYAEAVKKCLKKDINSIKWGTRVHSLEAMKLISVAEVLDRVNNTLNSLND